jgi:hypothetical protein
MLQRVSTSAGAIYRTLPTWGKVTAVIIGGFSVLYLSQLILGLFVIAALGVGIYTLIKWFVTAK